MPPASVKNHVEELLSQPVKNFQTVSGGSINRAARVTTDKGETFFLKWNNSAAGDMFPKEQKGLELLRSARSGLRMPEVIETGSTADGTDFILMTYLEQGSARSDSNRIFGEQLAELHHTTAEQYGLDHDNYIGRLPQSNKKHTNWIDFFIDERLEPQLQMALDAGKFSGGIAQNFHRLYKKLPDLLPEEPPSLLHGDLWGGNYFFDSEGHPAIYDPAVYYGNREIEIAFTYLFGGFSAEFYASYQENFPLQPNFSKRKDIYNLYPLLVHTNMFGGSYARQVEGIIQRY
ncbi:MAG TPA: fructosamine kinase family protein [Balneolaceae bacterium]|nr:fructosamine kinase family protein [Balneolaceae bacterium]